MGSSLSALKLLELELKQALSFPSLDLIENPINEGQQFHSHQIAEQRQIAIEQQDVVRPEIIHSKHLSKNSHGSLRSLPISNPVFLR